MISISNLIFNVGTGRSWYFNLTFKLKCAHLVCFFFSFWFEILYFTCYISQVQEQLLTRQNGCCEMKAWKKLRPEQDWNPQPLWYWFRTLPTELSSKLEACHIVSSQYTSWYVKNANEYMQYIFKLWRKIRGHSWSSQLEKKVYY